MTVSINPRKAGNTSSMVLLAASAVAASLTGTTVETILATIPVPAGAMGPNGAIEVRTAWSLSNSANVKTLRVRLGGIGGVAYLSAGVTTNAIDSDVRRIRNRGSESSQVGSYQASSIGGYGGGSAALPTGALSTALAQDVVITGQLALGTETITLEMYEVWLLPG